MYSLEPFGLMGAGFVFDLRVSPFLTTLGDSPPPSSPENQVHLYLESINIKVDVYCSMKRLFEK